MSKIFYIRNKREGNLNLPKKISCLHLTISDYKYILKPVYCFYSNLTISICPPYLLFFHNVLQNTFLDMKSGKIFENGKYIDIVGVNEIRENRRVYEMGER